MLMITMSMVMLMAKSRWIKSGSYIAPPTRTERDSNDDGDGGGGGGVDDDDDDVGKRALIRVLCCPAHPQSTSGCSM